MTNELNISLNFKIDADNAKVLLKYLKNGIKLVCANGYKKYYNPILIGFIENYKKQVIIICIKTNMQCSIRYIPTKKKELITRL